MYGVAVEIEVIVQVPYLLSRQGVSGWAEYVYEFVRYDYKRDLGVWGVLRVRAG